MGVNYFLVAISFISTIIVYAFSLFVIKANPKSWKNRGFFLYLFTKGLLFLTTTLIPLLPLYSQVLLSFKVYTTSIFFFSSYFLLFGLSFYLSDEKLKKVFILLTLLAICFSLFSLQTSSFIIEKTDYGWFFNQDLPHGLISSGYFYLLKGIGIFLLFKFTFSLSSRELKRNMKIISFAFLIHYLACTPIIILGRIYGTCEYDLYWPIIDVILFGIALRSFLKIKE